MYVCSRIVKRLKIGRSQLFGELFPAGLFSPPKCLAR